MGKTPCPADNLLGKSKFAHARHVFLALGHLAHVDQRIQIAFEPPHIDGLVHQFNTIGQATLCGNFLSRQGSDHHHTICA